MNGRFELAGKTTAIKVGQGDPRPLAVWKGFTLHGGVQELLQSPDEFEIAAPLDPDEGTVTIHATPNSGNFSFQFGNGVENSWQGYFSHGARETKLTIDAQRLVPLKEETRDTIVLYRDWKEVEPGQWVPERIEVVREGTHYRMQFDWLGQAIWLMRSAEMISADTTRALTRVRNVRINDQPVAQPLPEQEIPSRSAGQVLREMLDHNRPWLDGGPYGTGWQPGFETLSYSFRTVREEIVESCVVDRNGEAVVEVTHDGLGKLKDRLGARNITLNTNEYATSTNDAAFARLHERPVRGRGLAFDLALKHYTRIGCQLDLPLFRYSERINAARTDFADSSTRIETADGEWNGAACQKVTVITQGGDSNGGNKIIIHRKRSPFANGRVAQRPPENRYPRCVPPRFANWPGERT